MYIFNNSSAVIKITVKTKTVEQLTHIDIFLYFGRIGDKQINVGRSYEGNIVCVIKQNTIILLAPTSHKDQTV
jgi:hypothetical protein